MSEFKIISPLLDNFDVGGHISEHNGVRCYPAMRKDCDDKYIVKTVSIPASQTQLDALLLTGAYPSESAALSYFQDIADNTAAEFALLQRLAQLDGFLAGDGCQVVTMEERVGCQVYMLTPYRRTLNKHLQRKPATQLSTLNLGLDLCAALSVCRQAGYLYVDLKPENIFVTEERGYHIGDLGFIPLKSLKYASLPAKYQSAYSAPETNDPLSPLNETLDTYAVGMILYQIYNGGELPLHQADGQSFPAPMYADYELSEIILKACDPNPENRWQDPAQMGQALVSYMQRNGANDVPIVTSTVEAATQENAENISLSDNPASTEEIEEPVESSMDDFVSEAPVEEITEDTVVACTSNEYEHTEPASLTPEISCDPVLVDSENDDSFFENLSFLDDVNPDETAPENTLTEVSYDDVPDDISEILSQIDELAAHEVPAPVVAPDPVEINIPEIPVDESTESITDDTMVYSEEAPAGENIEISETMIEEASADNHVEFVEEADDTSHVSDSTSAKQRKSGIILRNVIIFLLVAIVGIAGYLYYQYVYLMNIDSVSVIGNDVNLIVKVESHVDESLLSVVCSDSHGTQLSAPVVNGQATFANLTPDTAYNIKILVDGFHRLTGDISASYSTPALTNIVQFNAVCGPEDGSVILSFTVEGPDSGQWSVAYSADGEEEYVEELLSHMVTLTGLTVGKEYSFKLIPGENMYVTGNTELQFTASNLIYAENLTIMSLINNCMDVSWNAPENCDVTNWTVRCYDNKDYNETIITTETNVTFENLDPTNSFTVEVTAAGMSVSERTYIGENAITISDFVVDTSNSTKMTLSWNSSQVVSDGGWILVYSIAGTDIQGSVTTDSNRAVISPMIPDAEYNFTLQTASGNAVLSGSLSCITPKAVDFSGYGITPKNITYQLCHRPEKTNWTRFDLSETDYTNEFKVGDEISLLVKLSKRYAVYDDDITSLYVIRDEEGNIATYSFYTRTWDDMWNQYYCEMNVPKAPTEPGNYTMTIYYNGLYTGVVEFTIV